MSKHTQQTWYARQGSMGQGYIADEDSGESIAIAYDFENAPLLAAAPELLACLLDVLDADGDLYAMDFDRYRAAIAKAESHA